MYASMHESLQESDHIAFVHNRNNSAWYVVLYILHQEMQEHTPDDWENSVG